MERNQPPGRWLPNEFGLALSQRDVDFVIPRLDADIRLCIDPFLLFKSKREDLRAAHSLLVGFLNAAVSRFREGDEAGAASLVVLPEVKEVRLGYAKDISGRGMGTHFGKLFLETLGASPSLVDRGVRHAEELQLFSSGIAEDRISDLAANVLTPFLIEYTQRQCELWSIPTEDHAPLAHVWDPVKQEWLAGYFRLPVDPRTGIPILLVPRWIVRQLPWINFDDYLRTDFQAFLRARMPGEKSRLPKSRVAEVSRSQLQLVDRYIDRKEREAGLATPDPPPLLSFDPDPAGESLAQRLNGMPLGRQSAYDYQRLMLAILNTLFEPELVDGQEQVRTDSAVEIRDLIFTNNSDIPFLSFLRSEHGNILLTFECKNVTKLQNDDVNQLAAYLGDPLGYCGILLTRREPSSRLLAKIRATYNKSVPRRVILVIDDADIGIMLQMRAVGVRHPIEHLQRKYRALLQSIE